MGLKMIENLQAVGSANGAPILLIQLEAAGKAWLGLAYKSARGGMSLCFWSTRDDEHMSTTKLGGELTADVHAALSAGTTEYVQERLFEIGYKQPPGWDRWGRPGVPNPIRDYFDAVLFPELKSLLGA
jgi:hypothetical protein